MLTSAVSVTETDSGGNVNAPIGYVLSNPSSAEITVNYPVTFPTGDNKAEAADVDRTTESTSIPIGMVRGTINIPVIPDEVYEGNEVFISTVGIPTATEGTVNGTGVVNVTIRENDAVPTISLTDGNIIDSHGEGASAGTSNTDIKVKLIGTSEHPITLNYEAIVGTAIGSDFTEGTGQSPYLQILPRCG